MEEISREKNYILRRNSDLRAMPTNELQRVFEDMEAEEQAENDRKKGEKHAES